jgi:hypothetical protein
MTIEWCARQVKLCGTYAQGSVPSSSGISGSARRGARAGSPGNSQTSP